MNIRLREITLLALVMLIVVLPNTTIGQDRYPLAFEEMSGLPPVPNFYQNASPKDDEGQDNSESKIQSASRTTPSSLAGWNTSSFGAEPKTYQDADSPAQEVQEPRRSRRRTRANKEKGNSLLTNRFSFQNSTYGTDGFADYVVQGRIYIGDNNSAQTDNRFIFQHNLFTNALSRNLYDGVGTTYNQVDDINQFIIGFERTLDPAEQWSLEMRLPIYGPNDAVFAGGGFSTQNASVGNVTAILKRQMYEDDYRIFSTGVGVSAPTGDDNSFIAGDEMFTVKNRAVHIAPFIAGLWTPNDKWFYHGFLTVDVAGSGNPIEYQDIMPCGCGGGPLGEMTNQTLLNVDLAAGYWWFRDRDDRLVTALSSMIELHYVTALNDADLVMASTASNDVEFTSVSGNAFDAINLTAGFDFNILNRLNLRFATVLPVQDGVDRFFDAEWQTSINFLH